MKKSKVNQREVNELFNEINTAASELKNKHNLLTEEEIQIHLNRIKKSNIYLRDELLK